MFQSYDEPSNSFSDEFVYYYGRVASFVRDGFVNFLGCVTLTIPAITLFDYLPLKQRYINFPVLNMGASRHTDGNLFLIRPTSEEIPCNVVSFFPNALMSIFHYIGAGFGLLMAAIATPGIGMYSLYNSRQSKTPPSNATNETISEETNRPASPKPHEGTSFLNNTVGRKISSSNGMANAATASVYNMYAPAKQPKALSKTENQPRTNSTIKKVG